MPVAAGMSFPMITFSFNPARLSTLPSMAASVRTRAVSWKEAVCVKRGLGDTHKHRVVLGGSAALLLDPLVLDLDRVPVGDLLGKEVRITRVVHHDLTQHLAHDHLDMLVVDVHALRPVDLLYLFDEVTLRRGRATLIGQ